MTIAIVERFKRESICALSPGTVSVIVERWLLVEIQLDL